MRATWCLWQSLNFRKCSAWLQWTTGRGWVGTDLDRSRTLSFTSDLEGRAHVRHVYMSGPSQNLTERSRKHTAKNQGKEVKIHLKSSPRTWMTAREKKWNLDDKTRGPNTHTHTHTHIYTCAVLSRSVWPYGLQPARLLCPWEFSRQEYWIGLPYPASII